MHCWNPWLFDAKTRKPVRFELPRSSKRPSTCSIPMVVARSIQKSSRWEMKLYRCGRGWVCRDLPWFPFRWFSRGFSWCTMIPMASHGAIASLFELLDFRRSWSFWSRILEFWGRFLECLELGVVSWVLSVMVLVGKWLAVFGLVVASWGKGQCLCCYCEFCTETNYKYFRCELVLHVAPSWLLITSTLSLGKYCLKI